MQLQQHIGQPRRGSCERSTVSKIIALMVVEIAEQQFVIQDLRKVRHQVIALLQ